MSEDLNKSLILAAEGGDLATVQARLAAGADPNAMGPQSGALHVAAFGGYLPIVSALLAAGANANLPDVRGFYALQLAISKNRLDVAQALLSAGADLEAKTSYGGTALHVAAASNLHDAAQLLLVAGADLEARDTGGNTALATACSLGCKGTALLLLQEGADLSSQSNEKESMLIHTARGLRKLRLKSWFSQGESNGELVQYSIKNGFFFRTIAGQAQELSWEEARFFAGESWGPTGHLPYMDAIELIQALMQHGQDINQIDSAGFSAFHLVCHAGVGSLIAEMLAMGANPQMQHAHGFQAIHLVAGSGRWDGLASFLAMVDEVDVNAKDAFGWTPAHWLGDIGGDQRMARLLIDAGADLQAASTTARGDALPAGMKPADVAIHWGDAEMAEALKA